MNFEELETLLLGEAEPLLQKEIEGDLAASIFHNYNESLDEIWSCQQSKARRCLLKQELQHGCHYWLSLWCSYFTLKSHKQQSPTVGEGKPVRVGPVIQGLGVPTGELGHIWLVTLDILLRTMLEWISIIYGKRVGEFSQKYLDADGLCSGRMMCWASAEELQAKQNIRKHTERSQEAPILVASLWMYIQNCF